MMREVLFMREDSVISCKKCGRKHYMTKDGRGHVMPVFCCGDELGKSGKGLTSRITSTKKVSNKK
jgi:hypothetical protein